MKDVISAGFLIGIGLFYFIYSWEYEGGALDNPGPGFFPRIIGLIFIFSNSLQLLLSFRKRTEKNRLSTLLQDLQVRRILLAGMMVGVVITYLIVLNTVGFLMASPFFVFSLAWVMGGRNWMANLVLGAVSSGIIYWLFWTIMRVPIPAGFLGGR
jgi:putative tricarboxylic transport membrane protein